MGRRGRVRANERRHREAMQWARIAALAAVAAVPLAALALFIGRSESDGGSAGRRPKTVALPSGAPKTVPTKPGDEATAGVPLQATVEPNPAKVPSFTDDRQSVVFPGSARPTGTPGKGCIGFHDWASRQGAVPAGQAEFRLTVRATSEHPVVVSAIRPMVIRRKKAIEGVAALCPSAGVSTVQPVPVDLDAPPEGDSAQTSRAADHILVKEGRHKDVRCTRQNPAGFRRVGTRIRPRSEWRKEDGHGSQ